MLVLAGCVSPPAPECGPLELASGPATICVDGAQRSVLLFVPDEPDGTLILVLHGGGSWGELMAQQTAMHDAAPRAIVAYPEGTPFAASGRFETWNAMHCCGPAFTQGIDDVAFLAALIGAVESERGEQRVLIAGHSNGGMMAYRFAAERPHMVDGFAVVAGTIGGRASFSAPDVRIPEPVTAVPVLIIHGLHDEQVPYAGGAGNDTVVGRRDASVDDAVALWRSANQADHVARHAEGAYVEDVYIGAAPVHVITTQGGHAWPRGAADEEGVEPDASKFIAAWFYDL